MTMPGIACGMNTSPSRMLRPLTSLRTITHDTTSAMIMVAVAVVSISTTVFQIAVMMRGVSAISS